MAMTMADKKKCAEIYEIYTGGLKPTLQNGMKNQETFLRKWY